MNSSLVQWPRAKYWTDAFNPIIGCEKVSPACLNCYAEGVCNRFGMNGADAGFKPTRRPRFNKLRRKGVVFCGNMTDLFGDWVEDKELLAWYRGQFTYRPDSDTFTPHEATYLWLTKRVERLRKFMTGAQCLNRRYHENIWFGITAENQLWYDRRTDELFLHEVLMELGETTPKLWLSAEPLLGKIDLKLEARGCEQPFDWVVVGAESGQHRRPCNLQWVESIVAQCQEAGVPVFVKQLDLDGKLVTDINLFPEHLRVRQVPWSQRLTDEGKLLNTVQKGGAS